METLLQFNSVKKKAARAARETELLTRWQNLSEHTVTHRTHLRGTQTTRWRRDGQSKDMKHFKILRRLTL